MTDIDIEGADHTRASANHPQMCLYIAALENTSFQGLCIWCRLEPPNEQCCP